MWIFISIIILLIYGIYNLWNSKKESTFWKYQPVSHQKSSNIIITQGKLITNSIPSVVPLKKNLNLDYLDLHNNKMVKLLSQFLNKNYVVGYKYTPTFLKWSINITKLNSPKWNIVLRDKQEQIVGSIISKPIDIFIRTFGKSSCVYVDYLSVKKEYRSQKLAPILISNTVKNCWDSGYNLFIFKKEGNPLPFNVICETHFYLLSVGNSSQINRITDSPNLLIRILDNSNIEETYQFFQKSLQKYSLYPVYNLAQFKHIFMDTTIVKAWILLKDTKIIGFTAFAINQFQMYTLKYQIAEIIYYIAPSNYFYTLFNKILQESHKLGLDKITLIDIMNNYKLIDKFEFQQSMKLNFQMYNYHHHNIIEKQDFAYNVL
jgi:hypothetical protein